MERKNAWLSYGESDEKEMEKLAKDYRAFLDAGKTEKQKPTDMSALKQNRQQARRSSREIKYMQSE